MSRRPPRLRDWPRRDVLFMIGSTALGWPPAARAQQRTGAPPATILVVQIVPGLKAPQALRAGLQQLGYQEGQDFSVERYAGEFGGLATELGRLKIEVIFANGPQGVFSSHRATTTVPIIALDLETDPIATGLIESYARPGGNLTGFFLDQPPLLGKWLQLIREAIPGASRIAVLWDPGMPTTQIRTIERFSEKMGLKVHAFEMKADTLDRVFASIAKEDPNALVILSSPLAFERRAQIAGLAADAHLPSITMFRLYAEAGGMMAYGPDPSALGERAASYVDKILKGARPGELPVEQPSKFDLVINLKTARALGLTIPPSLLARADEVIE
jgi:putative ABC transport system substrate-binding protein